MADRSAIEWTDATWNPVRGCSRVSGGCRHCYAERVAARFSGPGMAYEGLAVMRDGEPRWTGKLQLVEKHLHDPLHWKKPRRIFVNSMSDLFHEQLPDEAIDRVFAVMALAPRHTFQILTKRPARMRKYIFERWGFINDQARKPLRNVWLGVSAENQATAAERVPLLLQTPAVVHFLSAEPLLGPIDFGRILLRPADQAFTLGLNWIIVGGESGPGARPMRPEWAESIRDQCQDSGVAFFFKQWGEHTPGGARLGKKLTGRLLDGRTWDSMPEVR